MPNNVREDARQRFRDNLEGNAKRVKDANETSATDKELLELRKEVAGWAFLARVRGGDAVDNYEQAKEKYDKALHKVLPPSRPTIRKG